MPRISEVLMGVRFIDGLPPKAMDTGRGSGHRMYKTRPSAHAGMWAPTQDWCRAI